MDNYPESSTPVFDPLRVVDVRGLPVADCSRSDLLDALVRLSTTRDRIKHEGAALIFAAHVGALREFTNEPYMRAMRGADIVYADGASLVACARAAGATNIERAPTTDLGGTLIETLSALDGGRRIRVAVLGGPPGLAASAGAKLQELGAEIVFASDGYRADLADVPRQLEAARPEVIFVGLGAPREQVFCWNHRHAFPSDALVVTCGGWFGFLAGDERRAPLAIQRLHLEWAFRLAQDPKRLWRRYAMGAFDTAQTVVRLRRPSDRSPRV